MATRKTSAQPTAKRAPAELVKKSTAAKTVKGAKAGKAGNALKPVKAGGAEGLLRAGLKALGNVRNDVVKRQTHVIEGLLGIQKADGATDKPDGSRGFPGLDAFGIRKFEDVFDQRVATALQRLGMPTAQEVQALRDEIVQLRAQLAQLAPQPEPAALRPKR